MFIRRALLCLIVASPATAQTVHPGVHVRVRAPTQLFDRLEGVFLARRGDTLLFGNDERGPVLIPSAAITELKISSGKSRLRGALRGALWGAASMALLGAVAFDSTFDANGDPMSKGEFVAESAFGGAAIGAIIGAFVPMRVWKSADPRILLTAGASGAVGVRVVLRDD